jgi:hypothetical protein
VKNYRWRTLEESVPGKHLRKRLRYWRRIHGWCIEARLLYARRFSRRSMRVSGGVYEIKVYEEVK